MESDQKLDKLESFLGRLNSKGVCSSAADTLPAPESQRCFLLSSVHSGRSAGNHPHGHGEGCEGGHEA